jgi:hypothetical protein
MVKRGFTKHQVMELGFPAKDYSFPEGTGLFSGTLVMKKWSNNRGLICYFDTDDGQKRKLCVWFRGDPEKTYRPRKSDLDISLVELGSRLRVGYAATKSGNSNWLTAEILEVPK